jgi:hypothetical protein
MNGYGIISWPNGKVFQGQFVNNHKNGYGIYYTDTKVFIACWRNSKLHGDVIIVEKGIIKRSYWEEGVKLRNSHEDVLLNSNKCISSLISL